MGKGVETRNPATGAVISEYAVDEAGRIETLVADARTAFLTWRDMTIERRAAVSEAGGIASR